MKPSSVMSKPLSEAVQRLLRTWRKEAPLDLKPFTGLRLYLRLIAQSEQASPQSTKVARHLVIQALEILQERDKAAADLLHQRYLDKEVSAQWMAGQMAVSEGHYFKLQNEAINQLVEIILEQEQQARTEHHLDVVVRLEPPTYRHLFGMNHERQQLHAALERIEPPWLIAIDGIGGIGKTSLADDLIREIVPTGHFYDIAWVSARQQTFIPAAGLQETPQPALDAETLTDSLLAQFEPTLLSTLSAREKRVTLAKLLKKLPYLVVIDNLETGADYQALLPTLHKLAGPTKFLLTTRHSLCAHADIACISLKELGQAEALALLNYEIEARGLPILANASQAQLQNIYEVVGGNPLALKLVIGQACALPLSQVLSNLKQAQGKKINELYTYIYWQSWQALAANSRQALLAMPLAPAQGSTYTHLVAVSGLETTELSQALEQLVALSLVEVGGGIEQRRYRIHRLTETFLLTEVTKWSST